MNTNTDPVRALIDEMTEYLDMEIDPELDVIEQWRDRLEAAHSSAPPSAPTHPEFRVGVDVTRDGAHVVVLRCEGDAGEVIYSEVHPLRAPPSAPVGVEGMVAKLRAVLCDPAGNVCIEGSDADRAELQRALDALEALAQQPAAVDEAMVERACRHWYAQWDKADRATKMLWAEKMYDLLAAAHATQHQEPKP